jgi:enoyl-CoA hydratase
MTVVVHSVGPARIITIHRPERRNALAPETLNALRKVAEDLRDDHSVRGVVLTGATGVGVFLSGGDLQELAGIKTAKQAKLMARKAHAAVDALRALGVPLVAAVHGDAFGGGCELAAACDYRIAEGGVRFHWVQARFAVTTGWGGTANLLKLVSRSTCLRWLLTALPVTAEECLTEGFVDEIVATGTSIARAIAWIDAVAVHPREASIRMLQLVRKSGDLSAKKARKLELKHFSTAWANDAHHQAVEVFLKRKA